MQDPLMDAAAYLTSYRNLCWPRLTLISAPASPTPTMAYNLPLILSTSVNETPETIVSILNNWNPYLRTDLDAVHFL